MNNSTNPFYIVSKVWAFCQILRDDDVGEHLSEAEFFG